MYNKKSRIYGTSDGSDLSIYLSALLNGSGCGSGFSRERIRAFVMDRQICDRSAITNGSGCESRCTRADARADR